MIYSWFTCSYMINHVYYVGDPSMQGSTPPWIPPWHQKKQRYWRHTHIGNQRESDDD